MQGGQLLGSKHNRAPPLYVQLGYKLEHWLGRVSDPPVLLNTVFRHPSIRA